MTKMDKLLERVTKIKWGAKIIKMTKWNFVVRYVIIIPI